MQEDDLVATYTVGESQPPAFVNVEYWERSLDPWHSGAFKGTCAEGILGTNEPTRASGWMGIDWAENAVGFVPDGTQIQGKAPTFELVTDPNVLPCGNVLAVQVYTNWLSMACCIRHEGVYTEIPATLKALIAESQRDDVKCLLIPEDFWMSRMPIDMVGRDCGEAIPEGSVGTLYGKPIFSDAGAGQRDRRILPGRLFSVRKRTKKLVPSLVEYPLLHGVYEPMPK